MAEESPTWGPPQVEVRPEASGSARCAVALGWWSWLPMFLSYGCGYVTVSRSVIDLNMVGVHRVYRREQHPVVRETIIAHPLARFTRLRVYDSDTGRYGLPGIEINDGRRPSKTVYNYDYSGLQTLFRQHGWLP